MFFSGVGSLHISFSSGAFLVYFIITTNICAYVCVCVWVCMCVCCGGRWGEGKLIHHLAFSDSPPPEVRVVLFLVQVFLV